MSTKEKSRKDSVNDKHHELIVMDEVKSLAEARGMTHPETHAWLEKVFGVIVKGDNPDVKRRLVKRVRQGSAFDHDAMTSIKPREIFSVRSHIKAVAIRDDAVHDSIVEWRPTHLSSGFLETGCHEAFMALMIPGSTINPPNGDVNIPGIGAVEIKSTKDARSSSAQFAGLKKKCYGSASSSSFFVQQTCGTRLNSFGVANLRSFFAGADDTDTFGTAIAHVINSVLLETPRAADMILNRGFVRRLREIAVTGDTEKFREAVTAELLVPFLVYSFDYYKAHDGFDRLLLINREDDKAVWLTNGSDVKSLHGSGNLRLKPSAVNLNATRTGGVGVALQ